jgi:hypothetical protein
VAVRRQPRQLETQFFEVEDCDLVSEVLSAGCSRRAWWRRMPAEHLINRVAHETGIVGPPDLRPLLANSRHECEQSRMASATKATGLTVGCIASFSARPFWKLFIPGIDQTLERLRPCLPRLTLLTCGARPDLKTATSSCLER